MYKSTKIQNRERENSLGANGETKQSPSKSKTSTKHDEQPHVIVGQFHLISSVWTIKIWQEHGHQVVL